MKTIQHKVYILETEDGSDVNLNDLTSLNICVNDNVTELGIDDVFKKFEGYEDNKLVGWSILQFFKFEDGYLLDEDRNKISFHSKQQGADFYVKKIRNAIIMLSDIEIKDAYIRDVKKMISLSKGRVTENKQEQIQELRDDIKQEELNPTPEVVEEPTAEIPAEEPALAAPVVEAPAPIVEVVPEVVSVAEPVPAPVVEEVQKKEEQPVVETPAPEPVAAPEPIVETVQEVVAETPAAQPVTAEPEVDEDSYDYLKKYYIEIGYTEYAKNNFRLLYKEGDIPYVHRLTDDSFEQIPGDIITDNETKLVYEFEDKGKSKKITFEKVLEQA